jgi:hypothetical protein
LDCDNAIFNRVNKVNFMELNGARCSEKGFADQFGDLGLRLGEFQEAAAGGGDQPFVVQHPVLDERLGDTSDLRSVQALAKIRISGNFLQQARLLGARVSFGAIAVSPWEINCTRVIALWRELLRYLGPATRRQFMKALESGAFGQDQAHSLAKVIFG